METHLLGAGDTAVLPAGTFVSPRSGLTGYHVIDTATNTVVATVHAGDANHGIIGVSPELPGVSLTLNEATFHAGNTLSLTGTTYAGPSPRPVDAYISVLVPDGRRLFL